MKVSKIIRGFNSTFWLSNVIELFERWAWYGFYMAFALYLVNSKETGALGFSQVQKGLIMGTGSMLLYFLPVITGAIADRAGYRRILYLAFTIYISGFLMIRSFSSFEWVFFAFVWICVGGAFFKPIISAMIARNTNENTSSIGFGIFYMMVNIGAFIGPFIAGIVLNKSWDYVFFMSIAAIAVNFVVTFFFFHEPVNHHAENKLIGKIELIFLNIWHTLLNWRFFLFLMIMVLFWSAYNQLYYTFPIFVDQWVDTGEIYRGLERISPSLASAIGTEEGTISAVTISSIVAFYIILFQILVSAFVMRFRPLSAMSGGILLLSVGIGLMFSTQSGWLILAGILIFGLGEMASSPKFTEYIGRIAPDDRKALFMGTSYLPIAGGHFIAGWLSGGIYERTSDKIFLAAKELKLKGFDVPAISDTFTKNDFLNAAGVRLGMNQQQLTEYLWTNYHPSNIWHLFSGIAVAAVLFLFFYDKLIIGNKTNG